LLSNAVVPSQASIAYQNTTAPIVAAASTTATPAGLDQSAALASAVATDAPVASDPINVKAFVTQYFADTPILARIAGCESQFRQFDKDGQVLRGEVVHQDVGVMQINETYQGALASALGYNIYTLQGNAAYGKWLYDHEGAQPWSSSSGCWAK